MGDLKDHEYMAPGSGNRIKVPTGRADNTSTHPVVQIPPPSALLILKAGSIGSSLRLYCNPPSTVTGNTIKMDTWQPAFGWAFIQNFTGKESIMKRTMLIGVLLLTAVVPAHAGEGMVNVESAYEVSATADRFEQILSQKGMTLFNRIRHSESAESVGVKLRDTELLIFGNPKVGSPLMACAQSVGIDLPQKALFWKDEAGKVWISYNDPRYLETRHSITDCDEVISKIKNALEGMARMAAKQEAPVSAPSGFQVQ